MSKSVEQIAWEIVTQDLSYSGGNWEANADIIASAIREAAKSCEPWMEHKENCEKSRAGNYQPHMKPCTCGLTAKLKEINEND